MRCLACVLSVWMLVGCRNRSTTFTNPFMAPDRVPPPATRMLTPGTAQPYYPGDPTQTPAYAQPTYTAPITVPPATGYSPAPVTPSVPAAQPSGGWNTYPQPAPASDSRSLTPTYGVRPTSVETPIRSEQNVRDSLGSLPQESSPAVRVPSDNRQLRFAQASSPPESPWAELESSRAELAVANIPAQPIQPQQAPWPLQSATPTTTQNLNPPIGLPQRPQIRELTAEELQPTPAPIAESIAAASRDRFRPQGSRRQAATQSAFNRPSITRKSVFGSDANLAVRYGFGPRYEWLRGRLEYSRATNQWKLRYIPIQGNTSGRGNTDELGGSVLIDNPHVLGNLRPGDYVLVRGQLQTNGTSTRSPGPVYTVSIVQRQRIEK